LKECIFVSNIDSKTKRIIAVVVLLTIAEAALASGPVEGPDRHRSPALPSPLCDRVQAPEGNKVAFHAYARGVQIYRWNGAGWDFVAPMATLYADPNYASRVGIHYAGPTWESNSGSRVVAKRVDGCTPDTTAIPWLLLQSVSTSGPGVFAPVTYIQRVNTTGGVSPATSGSSVGEEVEVPYTAEYFFYRDDD